MSAKEAQAILFGLALGDALGAPTEFMNLATIKDTFGAQGIQELPQPALYTDDTQMTLALAEGLIEAGEADVDALMAAIGRHFVYWSHSPENNRAPGQACLTGVRNFEQGTSWREAGVAQSKGCGAAMRVAPIGYLYQHDVVRLREVATASSLITHRHDAALAASVGAAYLIKLALDGADPQTYLHRLFEFTDGLSEDFEQALRRVGHVLGWGDEVAAMRHIGEGWVAEEAVALALYCVLRYPNDYMAVVRRGATSNGDSDSIACIAGGIAGALLGLEAIPVDWRRRCENHDYLIDSAARLAVKQISLQG
ncbi:ADP-ribosylglycohydrolase family protein [Chloroflexota bacterium]